MSLLLAGLALGLLAAGGVLMMRSIERVEMDARVGSISLMVAAATGNTDMVRLLLERGADVSKQNYTDKKTALQTAVYADQAEVAALLLAYGANPDSKDSGHYTPLHLVAFRCHFASAAVLLDAGADVTLTDKEGKNPALHAQSCNADEKWREQIAPLLGAPENRPS